MPISKYFIMLWLAAAVVLASPSPEAPAPRETAMQRIDRLGLDKGMLDAFLADPTLALTDPSGALSAERRQSVLLDWRNLLDRRQAIAQIDADTARLVARRDREKALPPADMHRDDLPQLRAAAERAGKQLASVTLERDAASQALDVVRAKLRGAPSQPPSDRTTQEQLAGLLAHPFALPAGQLSVLELEVAARQRQKKALDDLVATLGAGVEAAKVSPAEVSNREQKRAEAAQEVAREQTAAEATIRRAEKDQLAAEKTQREAAAQTAAATSTEEKELAAARTRLGERTRLAADALKTLGQLKADAGAIHLARTEKDLDLYRWLLKLTAEAPAPAEVSTAAREMRPQVAALKVREASYAAKLSEVKDEQVALGASRAEADRTAKSKSRASATAAQEVKVIDGHRATLEEQAVTLTRIGEDLRGTEESTRSLVARLERMLGDEGLLVRRRPELASSPVRGLFDDLAWALENPARALRPVTDFAAGCWNAVAQDQTGAVALPLVLSMVLGIVCAVFGHRFLRHLSRRLVRTQGPATAAAMSIAAAAVLWVPAVLPALLGFALIPDQERGFAVLMLWLAPWSTAHLVLRLARKWFLVAQVPAGTARVASPYGGAWVDLVMPPLPEGELAVLEGQLSTQLWRSLLPLAAISCTLLPAYLTMREVLYRPELASQVWLIYELVLAGLLFRVVRLRAQLVQVRRFAGTARRASILVVALLRATVLLCLPAVPVLEAFGFGSLARFLVTRASLTVLIGHVVRVIFEGVLEVWRPPSAAEDRAEEDADEAGHETLGELAGSMLSFLLTAGTSFALFWIWGGTWGAWDAAVRASAYTVTLMGFDLSLRGLAGAAFALWMARWCASLTDYLLERRFFPRTRVDPGMRYAVGQTARYCIFAAGVFWALEAIGVGLEGVKWFAGFAGIGVGFGMQNIIQNFISGLIVLYERPVRVGDVVDVKGVLGIIQRISVRSTLLRQTSNVDVFVPNSTLLSENVVNWTLRGQRVRVEVPVALPPATDPARVRDVMLTVAGAEPSVLKRPAPAVLVEKISETALTMVLMVWVKSPLRQREIRSNLLFAVLAELRAPRPE